MVRPGAVHHRIEEPIHFRIAVHTAQAQRDVNEPS